MFQLLEIVIPFMFCLIWITVILSVLRAAKRMHSDPANVKKTASIQGTLSGLSSVKEPAAADLSETRDTAMDAYRASGVKSRFGANPASFRRNRVSADIADGSGIIRDDENDWLSRQRAEEQRALRLTSAMFDLKMAHHDNCDSEKNKAVFRKKTAGRY